MRKKWLLGMICMVVLFAGCESLDRVATDDRVVIVEDKINITVAQRATEEPQKRIEEPQRIPEMPQEEKRGVVWPYIAGGLIIGGLLLFLLSRKKK